MYVEVYQIRCSGRYPWYIQNNDKQNRETDSLVIGVRRGQSKYFDELRSVEK